MTEKHNVIRRVEVGLSFDLSPEIEVSEDLVTSLIKDGKYSIQRFKKNGVIYCDGNLLTKGSDGIYYLDRCRMGCSGCILSDCYYKHESLRISKDDLEILKARYPEKSKGDYSLLSLNLGTYKDEYKELLKERYPDGIDYDFSGSCACSDCYDCGCYDDEDK